MRLIDYDKLIKDLKDSGIPCDPDINEIITTQPKIDQAKEIERVKADLRKILDSYSSPVHFINTTEVDVDKFKEEMSKARLQIHPIEKQAAIYHGCYDCDYQPEPLMTCEWLHHQTTIYTQCPRWKARMMPPEQCK